MNRIAIIAALLSTLLLSGCGTILNIAGKRPVHSHPGRTTQPAPTVDGAPRAVMGPYGAKTNPYTVRGVRYYPIKSAQGYDETGVASWYGAENHGMRTASGSIYNMHAMSAAHKTLPLGTIVRVTNLENRRSLDVLVNDRGPFIHGRLIDMSYGAARYLGFADQGLTRVRVQAIGTHGTMVAEAPRPATRPVTRTVEKPATRPVVRPEPAPAPDPVPTATASVESGGGVYYVQVGAFSRRDNAADVLRRLERAGIGDALIETRLSKSATLHVVRTGPYADRERAVRALGDLRALYPGSFIAAL